MASFYETLVTLTQQERPFVLVTLVDALGSVPQNVGAKMLVTAEGLYEGTVGGGKIEKRAIDEAQEMLQKASQGEKTRFAQWNLNKDIGMTCGGTVKLYFELFNTKTWSISIFGAGHVAQALIRILLELDCRITCIDPRPEWLARLPESPRLKKVHTEEMPHYVRSLEENTFVVLMTMGHSTDKPILLEILKSRSFPYIGVIGSRAKARQLKQDVLDAGLPESLQTAFHCPIGLDIGSNHPQEIAISTVAQLLQVRDAVFATPASQQDGEAGQ